MHALTEPAPPTTTPSGTDLAARCGRDVVRLEGNWKRFLKEMPRLGVIRSHAGNAVVYHDRFGPYRWVRFIFSAGQSGGPEIDLRFFMNNWRHGFALTEVREGVSERSFHFLDKYGNGLHSIYLTGESHVDAFEEIVARYRSNDQEPGRQFEPRKHRAEKPDSEVDIEAFRTRWRKMWDTHQFFSLHRKFGLGRMQALRLGPPELVRALPNEVGRLLFENAARLGTGFMTFSGNRGCLQIYNGKATHFTTTEDGWFHVQEPTFHLHINQSAVAHAYEVKKPTLFGNVTSVELYDADGENVAVFYGKRGRLEKEHADWRELLATLPSLESQR